MAFDAETYLRLAGERMLLSRNAEYARWGSPVTEAARALVAAGVLEAAVAADVADDYGTALAVRAEGDGWLHHLAMLKHRRGLQQGATSALAPRRVVACDQVVELASGELHVRMVSLAEDATSLSAVYRPAPSSAAAIPARSHTRRRMSSLAQAGPPRVTLADDRGTTATGSFSGSGSESEWTGAFEADRPLAADTRWIEVDGERVEVGAGPPPCQVMVEVMPTGDPALGYLWRQLAVRRHFHAPPGGLGFAIDALVAAGAVAADDPELGTLRAVQSALDRGATPGSAGSKALPEPWRSLLAGGRRARGPRGQLAIGAVTPEFDGISVAVVSLESDDDGFQIEVEVAGGAGHGAVDAGVEETSVAWWAADDRGGRYLGETGNWGSSGGRSQGSIEFWPVLDPKASGLDLMPTARTSRAVITVPLSWART